MPKNLLKVIGSGLLVLMLIFPFQAQTTEKEIMNIVVIGWNGAERQRTKELLEKGELPHLSALVKKGKLLDIDVVTGATDTKAGWTQLLTGYVPEKTGVYNNGRYKGCRISVVIA
jgi:predicted AlkP superfamily phosphohydrolase/phosphomutase